MEWYQGYPVYIATKEWQKRKHRKKRINKKWLKRYGTYELNLMPHYPEYLAFADMVENWRTEIFNYFDNRYTNAITESLNRVSKEISAIGRGYNFKVLRAKILYRNSAVKQAKYSYYKPEKLDGRKIIEQCDMILDVNGVHLIIEPKSVSAGVDIDELSEVLRNNTSFIYQKAVEKLLKEK